MVPRLVVLIMAVFAMQTLCAAEHRAALLVIDGHRVPQDGGNALRHNLQRMSDQGYRIEYRNLRDMADVADDAYQAFDVIVMLNHGNASMDGQLSAATLKTHDQIRQLLKAGGGLLCFTTRREGRMRSFDALMKPYGINPLSGILVDDTGTDATHGWIRYAYTELLGDSPLTAGLKGCWYPVQAPRFKHVDTDIWRNPNTYPFSIDATWLPLVSAAETTTFRPFTADEAANTPFLQDPAHLALNRPTAPLLAIREGVEGAGRAAVCAIDCVYTDFVGGRGAYEGIVTGKGLNGNASDFGRVLERTLDWLAEPSLKAGRDTLPESRQETFAVTPFSFPEPAPFDKLPSLTPQLPGYTGLVGARSTYSGGASTVAEYALAARKLGLDYLVFLEDYRRLSEEDFAALQAECEAASGEDLVLLPGIFIQSNLGIWYFGFRKNLQLPQEAFLKPDTRQLEHYQFDGKTARPCGVYNWVASNGYRTGMATGNFRLEDKLPGGVPPSDYNFHNPFISLFTYQDGKQIDSLLDTYRKCSARTEWVSPIALNFVTSADQLAEEWASNHMRTVFWKDGPLRTAFDQAIGEQPGFQPISYVTNGPRIDEWRDSGFDGTGEWYDWTHNLWRVRFAVSSDAGLAEVQVWDGQALIRRYLPGGAEQYSQELLLSYNDMQNLSLVVTDKAGRQAFSDERWCKNLLLQLAWCQDRNNCLAGSIQPAPKDPTGSTGGNWAAPISMDKGAMRETLVPGINQNFSRLPDFDGQPYYPAMVSAAPTIRVNGTSEGGVYELARDFDRAICSPDVAIHNVHVNRRYDPEITHPRPWTRGPLQPTHYADLEMRYITFSHPGHWPAPVLVEGNLRFKEDITFPEDEPLAVEVMNLQARDPRGGYTTATIISPAGEATDYPIAYKGNSPAEASGALAPYSTIYFSPSTFGSVGIIALEGDLTYRFRQNKATICWNAAGRSFQAGEVLRYRFLTFISAFDEAPGPRLPNALRQQLGLNPSNSVAYTLDMRRGRLISQEYVLRLNGLGTGATVALDLPADFPCALPIVVENLNDNWTAVCYDLATKRLRVIGQTDGAAWCHQSPEKRHGEFFIGHPVTADQKQLRLAVVQTGEHQLTLQLHNPSDAAITTTLTYAPELMIPGPAEPRITIPAGTTRTILMDGFAR